MSGDRGGVGFRRQTDTSPPCPVNDSAAAAPNFEIGWRRLSQMPASLHSALLSGFPNFQREAGFGDHHSSPVAHRTEAQILRNRRAPDYS